MATRLVGLLSLGLAVATCAAAMARSARAEIPPDDTLADRQEAALQQVAPALTPLAPYDNGDRSDCVAMGGDGHGLVAQLELDRRGLSGGIDPASAAPLAKHMADKVVELVGTFGTQGRCHWTQAGAPGVMGATMSVAYALHRYGSAWPSDVKESIRAAVQDASWTVDFYLHNANITIVAAELLAGEALANQTLYDLGVEHLDSVVERTVAHGGIEQHAPGYTAHHVPPLVYLQALSAERERNLGRILLEYGLLQEAHQVLPDGGYSAPQSRDYSGGIADGGDRAMLPVLWLLLGDPSLTIDIDQAYGFVAAAATDYAVPEVIRSILIDKAEGYTFWTYTDAQQGASRTPDSVYDLGLDGARAIPWQTVVLPGGTASLGVAYGYRRTALYVSSGTYVADPTGGHHILYQYQPTVLADTDHLGDSLGGAGKNDDPDDF
ncbi:MAG: hypothetical protein JRI68_28315, partial [Deltaproteobacteria bacterium]|nr:hypothetical protein [Deltaproteobacteria bacterium]